MESKTILCVEDNAAVQAFNRPLLEAKGFAVVTAMTLAEAWKEILREEPALIILDIHMPDGNGLDFLRELRRTSQVPVLMLTGDGKDQDLVAGFQSGCDDYVPKPYSFPVLYARIEGLLRRSGQMPDILQKGPLALDIMAGGALLNGEDLRLTQKDFALLLLFIQNEGKIMSAQYLYEKVWKLPMSGDSQAIKSAISRLRKKLDGSGCIISSLRNEGYSFSLD